MTATLQTLRAKLVDALAELDAAAVVPPPGFTQFILWDGPSGPTRGAWNKKIPQAWVHGPNSVDFLDKNQVSQGAANYGTFTASPSSLGRKTIGPNADLVALVNRWLVANRGAVIKGVSGSAFSYAIAGRLDAAHKPFLTVVTTAGTFTCPATATANTSYSQVSWNDGRTQFQVQTQPGWIGLLQFDLSAITGTVTSASVTLWVNKTFATTGSATFGLWEMDPPLIRVGGDGVAPTLGLAANYPRDAGIENDPAVIKAFDFDTPQSILTFDKGGPWDSGWAGPANMISRVYDASSDSTYLRSGFSPGDLGGGTYEQFLHAGPAVNNVPPSCPTEIYFRYYVYLEADWGDTTSSYKMPGIEGRFGLWVANGTKRLGGYWTPVYGSSGGAGNGKYGLYGGQRQFQGWSMRGHGGEKYGDGNPYDDLFRLRNYCYYIDFVDEGVGTTGSFHEWGRVIEKGKWYCIEQRCKMNTIDMSAPDADGNGVARFDGVYEVWIDGVKCPMQGPKLASGWRWSHHPRFGIQGIWTDWYHGGLMPVSNPEHDQHYRMKNIVVASKYIGPMV